MKVSVALLIVAVVSVFGQEVAGDPYGLIGRKYTDPKGDKRLLVQKAEPDDGVTFADTNEAQYRVTFLDSIYGTTKYFLCSFYKSTKTLSCDDLITYEEFQQMVADGKKKKQQRMATESKRKKQAELDAQQAAFDEKKRFQEMERKGWPKEIVESIRKKSVRIGMTTDQARESWGRPEDIHRTITASTTSEQWVYGSNTYLYFTNDILTAIQD